MLLAEVYGISEDVLAVPLSRTSREAGPSVSRSVAMLELGNAPDGTSTLLPGTCRLIVWSCRGTPKSSLDFRCRLDDEPASSFCSCSGVECHNLLCPEKLGSRDPPALGARSDIELDVPAAPNCGEVLDLDLEAPLFVISMSTTSYSVESKGKRVH